MYSVVDVMLVVCSEWFLPLLLLAVLDLVCDLEVVERATVLMFGLVCIYLLLIYRMIKVIFNLFIYIVYIVYI